MRRLLVELAARRPHGEGAGGDLHQLVYCGGDGRVRAGQLKRVRHPGSRAGTAARNAAPPRGRRPSVRETDDARGGSRDRVSHDLDAQKVETRRRQVALFVEAIPGQIVVPRPALLFEPAHGTPPQIVDQGQDRPVTGQPQSVEGKGDLIVEAIAVGRAAPRRHREIGEERAVDGQRDKVGIVTDLNHGISRVDALLQALAGPVDLEGRVEPRPLEHGGVHGAGCALMLAGDYLHPVAATESVVETHVLERMRLARTGAINACQLVFANPTLGPGRNTMPRYLTTIEFSPAAYKGLIDNPHNRMEAGQPLFNSIGGTVEHYWFGVGENRAYVVFSAPDNSVDVQAVSMAVLSSGTAVKATTSLIITAEEGMAAAQKAAQLTYRSPVND